MAQDMGDDLGELLMRWVARRAGEALRQYLANYQKNAAEWTRQRFIENGMDPYRAQAEAQAAAAREAVCVPFGSAQDAALFAQTCRQDDVYAMPFTDPQGNGFLQFAVADLDRMQPSISRFAQEVARQHEQWIADTLRQPISPEKLPQLREIPITDRPRTAPEQAPAQERAAQAQETPNRTQAIADKVQDARDRSCYTDRDGQPAADFGQFRQRLAAQGIGVTHNTAGELLYYEARMGADGQPLPFEHRQDWSVSADTLRNNYGVDATQKWFDDHNGGPGNPPDDPPMPMQVPTQNPNHVDLTSTPDRYPQAETSERVPASSMDAARSRPTVTDGALDQRGETPDLNQGIRSHDGMDTDTRTMRIEREQNGTDVPPSKVREEKAYSLDSEAREARDASRQLAKERGQTQERVTDISDKLNPVR